MCRSPLTLPIEGLLHNRMLACQLALHARQSVCRHSLDAQQLLPAGIRDLPAPLEPLELQVRSLA